MNLPTESLSDIFAEEEARRLAADRAEIEREQAEYAALSPEERAAKTAAYEAKYAAFDSLPPDDGDEDCDDEEDSDDGD